MFVESSGFFVLSECPSVRQGLLRTMKRRRNKYLEQEKINNGNPAGHVSGDGRLALSPKNP